MFKKKEETDSLAHTRWNCKYHIVFAPKYRRQIIYGQIKADVGSIIRKLCEYKGVEILEAEACPDHIHRPDRKFCVNADKLSSRKEEQLRGFFGLDTGRLNSAYPPVFRGEKRYARAA